jgi:hypothetical protein
VATPVREPTPFREPNVPAEVSVRVAGTAFTNLGFKTFIIVCLEDAVVMVRSPWFLGMPMVIAGGILAVLPMIWLHTTIHGTNRHPLESAIMAVAGVVGIVLLARYRIGASKKYEARLAGASRTELSADAANIAFPLVTLRSMRFRKPNELWLTTPKGEVMFGIYGTVPLTILRAQYPTLWKGAEKG